MDIQMIKLGELKPYKNNPRKNAGAVDSVANSIKTFGFKQPIVIDNNSEIVAGHTRFFAAKKLGLPEVPCVVADDLTPEQIKAFRLADNKTHELSEWDLDLLDIELKNIFDVDMTDFGFDLGKTDQAEPEEDDFDVEANIPETPVSQVGDIYQLGRHRLICGDSTDKSHVAILMNGARAY